MDRWQLNFEYSPWFILLCLLAGAIYAFVLYQKKGPWSKTINYLLATGRFLLVSLLTFLLVGPIIKQIRNETEPPHVVVAIDNTLSVKETSDSLRIQALLSKVKELAAQLQQKDYQVSFRTFDGASASLDPAEISFDHQQTNLDDLLSDIQNDYENRQLGGVILLSDGLVNRGISPDYRQYNFNIHTIGLGDTTTQNDVNLRALYYNQITYQGNKFPIVAELSQSGFQGQQVLVEVQLGSEILDQKYIELGKGGALQKVEFLLEATDMGLQHYVVRVRPLDGEYTEVNNLQHAYIDVVEGKEKILLVAPAPHPDIKAIRSALEMNQNYELETFITTIDRDSERVLQASQQEYDLVIFHQIPDSRNSADAILKKFLGSEVPLFFIVGPQTNLRNFNQVNDILELEVVNNQKDMVTPAFNNNFSRFLFPDEQKGVINEFSPVSVPFGKITLKGEADIILQQRVGRIVTDKPMLVVRKTTDLKRAVFLGAGFWQWRLQEFAKNENHEAFDALIQKLVQYLSAREDRRKFKVYPVKNEFLVNESIVFETEVYNDIYEPTYGHRIDLAVTGENNFRQEYSYVTNPSNSRYRISDLKQGIYRYQASTTLDGELLTSSGEFSVKELQIELMNLKANHNLLQNLSSQSNGKFYLPENLENLEQDLLQEELKGLLISNEEFLPIINKHWIFFLLLSIVSLEWFTRKFYGSY
jgi:hypothetical protein